MRKKLMKGLYALAVMLMSVGAVAMVPSLSAEPDARVEESVETSATPRVSTYAAEGTEASEPTGNWANQFDASRAESSTPFGNPVSRPDGNYYQITNAEDLALLSYLVATATSPTWLSAKYELTADIDLAGSYWTPIGVSRSYPFFGTFNGNFHTIKNIVIEGSSAIAEGGLFGYLSENAFVCNLTVDGFRSYLDDSDVASSGAVAGYAIGATIANVYAKNTNGFYGIADSTNCMIYRGWSSNGTSNDTSFSTVESTLTINVESSNTYGYAIMFNFNGGAVYKYQSKTSLGSLQYSRYGVLINSSGAVQTGKATYGPFLGTRAAVMSNASGVFAIKVGNEFTVKAGSATLTSRNLGSNLTALAGTGYIATLNWTPKKYTLNAYYNYSPDTPIATELQNDAVFPTSFSRVGYTLAGRYTNAALTTALSGLNFVGDTVALSGTTYSIYLKWNPLTNIGYNVHMLLDGQSPSGESGNVNASIAYDNLKILEGSGTENLATNSGDTKGLNFNLENHTSSNSVTISFDLNYGFEFGAGTNSSVLSTSQVFNNAGVYHVFAAGRYDTKAPVTSVVAVSGQKRTITLNNIVGSGDIYIVFKRAEVKVALETSNVTVALTNNSSSTSLNAAKTELTTKVGDVFTLTFDIDTTKGANLFITNYGVVGFNRYVNAVDTRTSFGGGSYVTKYTVSTITNDFFKTDSATGNKITAIARGLEYTVNLTMTRTESYTDSSKYALAYAAHSVDQNGTSGNNTHRIDLASDGMGRVYMLSNDYYTFDSLSLVTQHTNSGNDGTSIPITIGSDKQTILSNGYVQYAYDFKVEVPDNLGEEIPEYYFTFTAKPQEYSVETEIYIDGVEATEEQLTAYGLTSTLGNGVAKPNDTTTITFNLGANGTKYLVNTPEITCQKASEKIGNTEIDVPGAVGTMSGNTYTFGTRDTIVRADYTTKKITLDLSATAVVKDLNGKSGVNGALDGFTYNKDSLGATVGYDAGFNITVEGGANEGNINMITGYYLVGWYLQNGDIILDTNLENIINTNAVRDLVAANEGETLSLSVQPVIQQKTIKLSFGEGADEHNLITPKNGDADKTTYTFTYYHAQETFDTTAAFSLADMAGLFQKIGTSALKSWRMTEKDNVYAFNATSEYIAAWDDIYGEGNETTFNFTPNEWTNIVYTVAIDASNSISVSLGNTIYLVYDKAGNATYHNGELSVGLTAREGYTANKFSFNGNGNTATILGNLSGQENAFTLSEENIVAFLASEFHYQAGTAFTITTNWEPVVYKVFISYTNYENFATNDNILKEEGENGRYYIEVPYQTAMAGLADFETALTRSGYIVSGWRNITDNDTITIYNKNSTYDKTHDITVKAIWTVDTENSYININLDGDKSVYYNGKEQTLGTASILPALEDGKLYLSNGEKVNKGYWAKVDNDGNILEKFADNQLALSLTNVSQSGKYVYVIEVVSDTSVLISEGYTAKSTPITIEIKKNTVVVVGSALESYYTGTEKFIATDTSVVGGLYFKYDADGNELNITAPTVAYEISSDILTVKGFRLLSSNGYAVSDNVEIDYILDTHNYENNFTSFDNFGTAEGYTRVTGQFYNNSYDKVTVTNAYFLRVEGNKIVQTTLAIDVNGRGFYIEGMRHQLKLSSDKISVLPDKLILDKLIALQLLNGGETAAADTFALTLSVETKTSNADNYDDVSKFNIDYSIKLNNQEVKNNFAITVTGNYVIEDTNASNSYSYNYQVGYLTANEGMLQSITTSYAGTEYYNIKITQIKIGSVTVSGDQIGEFYIYTTDAGEMLVTIAGNGTKSLDIVVRQGYDITFTVTPVAVQTDVTSSNLVYLGLNSRNLLPEDRDELITNFTEVKDLDQQVVLSGSTGESNGQYYTLFTDVKYITLDKGNDDANKQISFFLSAGDTRVMANPTWKGFEFTGWQIPNGSGVTAEDNGANGYNIQTVAGKAAVLTAQWTLLAPTVTTPATKEIVKNASESAQTITFTEVAGTITNENNAITYTYRWFKGETLISGQTGRDLSLSKVTTNDEGSYTLQILATYNGQTAEVNVPFTLKVTTVKIISFTLDRTSDTYKNEALSLNANLNFSVGAPQNLNILNKLGNGTIKFTISYKQSADSEAVAVSEIKNAGIYTITLVLDTTIYEFDTDVANSQIFTVGQFEYTLKESDVSLSKVFGESDPKLQTILNLNREDVTVEFIRGAGEAVGNYALSKKSVNNSNYNIIVPANTWFKINKTTSNLYLSFSGNLTMVYNGKTPASIETIYDNGWKAIVKDSDNNELARVNMNLKSGKDEESTSPVTVNLDTAFNGFIITIKEISKNVGEYDLEVGGTSSTYAGIFFEGTAPKFTITKATIVVKNVVKTFDEAATFTWNSLATDNTTTLTAENLVAGEDVTISGSMLGVTVGTYGVSSLTVSGKDSGNYNVTCSENGRIKVSDATIALTNGTENFNYGQIKESTLNSPSTMRDLLQLALTANGNASDAFNAGYVTISSVTIASATYSKGGNLNVLPEGGKYTVSITLTSSNYTKANENFNVQITINTITIDLSGNTVTKQYDGTNALPPLTWNMAGLLSGDQVTVTGNYNSTAIGTGIALTLNLTGADAANYTIKTPTPTGSITSKEFKFTPNYATIDFANDGVTNPTGEEFTVTYNGNSATFLSAIASHYATRQGYTQTGWTYGTDNTDIKTDFDTFLSAVVEANKKGTLTLNAVWQIEKREVVVNVNNATVKVGDTTLTSGTAIEVDYFSSITLNITGNEGYKYVRESHTGTATLTETGKNTLNATVNVSNITSAVTISLVMEEITVTFKATKNDTNLLNTTVTGWASDITLNYSALNDQVDKLLTTMTATAGTYTQTAWTLGAKNVALTDNLLALVKEVKGTLTEDTVVETLAPVWTGVAYTITFNKNDENATFVTGSETIDATYGEPLTGFPTVAKTGMNNIWNTKADGTGTTYAEGNKLTTRGTLNGDKYSLTLYAIWSNADVDVTINPNIKSEGNNTHITRVTVDGTAITAPTTNTLNFASQRVIVVSLDPGYELDTTETKLTAGKGQVKIEGNTITLSAVSEPSTLNIVAKAKTYTVTLNATYATVNPTSIQVVFDSTMTNLPTPTRDGYTFKSWTDSEGNEYSTTTTYTVAGDITLNATWTVKTDKYVTANIGTDFEAFYNGANQQVASATLTAGGKTITVGETLTNGEKVTSLYYEVKNGETYSKVADGATLTLKDVTNTSYRLAVVIEDLLTSTSYTAYLAEKNVNIKAAAIEVTGENLVSYYTGTNAFVGTDTATQGTLQYVNGETPVTEITISRVVFEGTTFNVATGLTVRYYLNIEKDLLANYSDISGNETDGYYITVTGASIIATPLTITAKGQGFETGSKHIVNNYDVTTDTDVSLTGFNVTITLTTTGTTGPQTSFTEADFTVMRGTEDVTSNFTHTLAGIYTILSKDNTYQYTFDVKYLTSSNGSVSLEKTTGYTIKLSALKVGENNVYIGEDSYFNYTIGDTPVFTLSGNNTDKVVLVVNDDYTLTFNATINGAFTNATFLTFTSDTEVESLKSTLATLTALNDKTIPLTGTTSQTLTAVVTDVKVVTLNYGACEQAPTTVYAKIGEGTTITPPTWTGFTLKGWSTVNGVTISGATLSVPTTANILPVTLTAEWEITKPTTSLNNQEITINASEGNENINLASVIGVVTDATSDLTYTYSWYNASNELLASGETLTVKADTDAVGDYYVVVTASKAGLTSVNSDHIAFTIKVTKATLNVTMDTAGSFEYNNTNRTSDITFTVNGEKKTLASLLTAGNVYLTISNGTTDVIEIKNVGTYTISVNVNDKIYNTVTDTFTVKVTEYDYEIKDTDVAHLWKYVGASDPNLEATLTLNGETLTVYFTRETGETAGTYKLSIDTTKTNYSNYNLSIDENNKYFEVKASTNVLVISLASELKKTYDKETVSLSTRYEGGVWKLVVTSGTDEIISDLTFQTLNGDTLTPFTSNENTLAGAVFSLKNPSVNAGSYEIEVKGGTNYPNAAFNTTTYFTIDQKGLVVTKVTKVFDRTNTFDNSNVTYTGVVAGDSITLTGTFDSEHAGDRTATFTINGDAKANYKVVEGTGYTATITTSSEAVDLTVTKTTFNYGEITDGLNKDQLLALLGTLTLTIGSGYTNAIADGYVTISNVSITSATYSKGGNLNVLPEGGKYTVSITLTSSNYTKANENFNVQITINTITIDLSGNTVTKQYDGTNALPPLTWNMAGLLSGDQVTVTGNYNSTAIGTGIALTLNLTGADAANYTIKTPTPTGSITSKEFKFTPNYATIDFANDGVTNPTGEEFTVTYNGNSATFLSAIASHYATRQGYTQTGWTYGTDNTDIKTDFDTFLSAVVEANKKGTLTLNAVWQIEKREVVVNVNNATVKVGDTTLTSGTAIEVDYFSSITLNITGNEGYKYVRESHTGTATLTETGKNTLNATVNVSNITSAVTISLVMEEITVTFKATKNDTNLLNTTVTGWASDITLNYSALNDQVDKLLTTMTATAGTYTQTAWTLGAKNVALTDNLLALVKEVKGTLTEDTVVETLAPVWTGVAYTITFNKNDENATFVTGSETIDATYGEPLTGFPTVAKTGMNNIWNTKADGTGTTYAEGNKLTTRGTLNGDKYSLTLYAIWSNADVDVTINPNIKSEGNNTHITRVTVDGTAITAPTTNTLNFASQRVIVVSLDPGYELDTTETKLTAGKGQVKIEGNTITLSAVSEPSTLNIVAKAKTYTVTLNATYATVNPTSIQVVFDSTMTNLPTPTRDGYTFKSWTDSEGNEYSTTTTYTVAGDITLNATWTVKTDKYVTANIGTDFEAFYNGANQQVASATLTAGGKTITVGETLTNGEKVTSLYYEVKNGETYSKVADGATLTLKDVTNTSYRLAVVIEDLLTSTSYTAYLAEKNVNIKAAAIEVTGENLVSYYTGTNAFVGTDTATQGTLQYVNGETPVTEITISRVVFEGTTFNVATGLTVRYYLNIEKDLLANYSDISGNETDGYYITVTGASIIATPLTITAKGQGFETGSKHIVNNYDVTTDTDVSLTGFNVTITLTTTGTTGPQTSFTEADFTVMRGTEDVTSNFTHTLAGIYTILSKDNTYQYTFDVKYLTSSNGSVSLEKTTGYTIKLSALKVGENNVYIGEDSYFNYTIGDTPVFTLSGNNTDKVVLVVNDDYTLTFNATINGAFTNATFLTFTSDTEVESLKSTLATLTALNDKTIPLTGTTSQTLTAVVTDVKVVTLNYGACEQAPTTVYAKIGEGTTITPPTWTGFTLKGWSTVNGVTISGATLSVPTTANILPVTLTAEWEITKPTTSLNNQEITINASEGNENINLASVIGVVTDATSDLTYTYSWYNASNELLASGETLTVKADTDAVGDYYVVVTASKAGLTSVNSDHIAFTIKVTKATLNVTMDTAGSFEYNNTNRTSDITFTVNGEKKTLASLLTAGNVYLTISNGTTDVIEIKNVGTYTISVNVNDKIYNTVTDTFTVKVTEYDYEIKDTDVAHLWKYVGASDPNLEATLTLNGETLTVYFTRETGETAGTYKLSIDTTKTNYSNYNLSIDENNKYFEVKASTNVLVISLASELKKTYDKETVSLSTRYEGGVWKLVVTSGTDEIISDLTFQTLNGDTLTPFTSNENTLAGAVFSLKNPSVNAGSYEIEVKGGTNYPNAAFNTTTYFTIDQKGLVVTKVTKVFDRTNTFDNSNVTYTGVVAGDSITLTGTFDSEHAGDRTATFTINGDAKANYKVVEGTGYTATITTSSEAVDLTVTKTTFNYGEITDGLNKDQLLALLGDFTLTIGSGYTNAIADGYVTISNVTLDNPQYSSSHHLKVGSYIITIALDSSDYSTADIFSKPFNITVNTINIDLSSTVVDKVYDNTTDIINATWDLSAVLAGDNVSVSASYQDKTVGENKTLNVEFTGLDAGNYQISNKPTGRITATSVRLVFNNTALADFVNDKEIYASKTYADITYPTTDAAGTLGLLTKPTREGYHVTNWAYEVSTGRYEAITEANIIAVLDKAYGNGKELTIYAEWEKNDIIISITSVLGEVAKAGDVAADTYTIKYYDDITFTVLGNVGYKLDDVTITSGTIVGGLEKSGVGTRKDGTFTLHKVASDIALTVEYLEIKITVNIDKNIPQYTQEVGEAWTSETFVYSMDAKLAELLPEIKVLSGTYTQTKWTATFGTDIDVALDDSRLLKDIIGEEINSDEDAVITFKAEWAGVNYTITFNKNDVDATIEGDTTINVVYGQSMADKTFPTVTKIGMKNTWNTSANGSGKYYTNEDIFQTRDETSESNFAVTLYAIWANEDYTFTVEIDDSHVKSVLSGGVEVTNGNFTLRYGTSISFVVTVDEGYLIACNEAEFAGVATIEKLGKTLKITNLSVNDKVFKIFAIAQENTMTVNTNLSTLTNVTVGGEVVTATGNTFKADTGKEIVLTFTAEKGYTFDKDSLVNVQGGIIVREETDGVLKITWTGFTSDSIITVTPSAVANVVTLKDSSNYVSSLYINSTLLPASGATYNAMTGSELTVSVLLKYGFKNITLNLVNDLSEIITSENIVITKLGEETWDESAKAYRQSFTITGFVDAFNIKVSAEARDYNFAISSGNTAMGSVTPTTAALKFGESLNLTATVNSGFAFIGWFVGEKAISLESEYTFVLNESNKTYLESGDPIEIVANFDYSEAEFIISTEGNGSLVYKIGDGNEIVINQNGENKSIVSFNTLLTIKTVPNRGYAPEFKFYSVDGSQMTYTNYTYDESTGIMVIRALADGPRHIKVEYVACKASIKVEAGVQINYQMSYGTDIGGTIHWSDENGNLKTVTGGIDGVSYTIETATGNKEYFVVNRNSGFSFTMSSKNAGVIINRLNKDGKVIFEVDGIVGDIEVEAVFTAEDNNIDVYFEDENHERVLAGKISVSTSGYVVASGNDSSSVKINALTGQSVSMEVSTNLTFSFDEERERIFDANDAIKDKVIVGNPTDDNFALGYTRKVSVTITDIDSNGYIVFYVKPKAFKIQFINEHEEFGPIIEGVKYGYDIPTYNPEEIIPESKEGYLFKGYYTKELGQGNPYFGENGQAVSKWFETGYDWNGREYETAHHYDPNTETFTLYAAWYYSKEKITIDFIPDTLKNKVSGIKIGDLVTPTSSNTTVWTTGDNLFYAEVKSGVEMLITAYKFEGYEFQYWYIDRGNGDVLRIPGETYSYTSQNGEILISAVYKAEFDLEAYDETAQEVSNVCGEVYLNTVGNNKGYYDTEEAITIYAVENKGYMFKGWFDTKANDFLRDDNDNIILGQKEGKVYAYTFESADPLYLRAVFEGKSVTIQVSDFVSHGNIITVKLNDTVIEKSEWNNFVARIGDQITIELTVQNGYGVNWDGPTFTGGYGVYTYRVSAVDILSDEEEIISIRPIADPSPLKYFVEVTVEGKTYRETDELDIAGKVTFRDKNNQLVEINSMKTIDTLYGVPVYIAISINPNYKFDGVYVDRFGSKIPLQNVYFESQGQIVINTSQIEEYLIGDMLNLSINIVRMIWTGGDFSGKILRGEGIEGDPYIISNADELALMAYLVNNGIINEVTGKPYAEGYYSLTADISLSGKYWDPIGTETHKFAGVLNLNTFRITGISLCPYEEYLPRTYYEGLFWCMTNTAQVIQSNNTLMIALISAGGVLLLLLLLLLILLLVRRRKKKKMEELANS